MSKTMLRPSLRNRRPYKRMKESWIRPPPPPPNTYQSMMPGETLGMSHPMGRQHLRLNRPQMNPVRVTHGHGVIIPDRHGNRKASLA